MWKIRNICKWLFRMENDMIWFTILLNMIYYYIAVPNPQKSRTKMCALFLLDIVRVCGNARGVGGQYWKIWAGKASCKREFYAHTTTPRGSKTTEWNTCSFYSSNNNKAGSKERRRGRRNAEWVERKKSKFYAALATANICRRRCRRRCPLPLPRTGKVSCPAGSFARNSGGG